MRGYLLIIGLALLAAGCRQTPPPFNETLPVKSVMAEVTEPAADELWRNAGEIDTLEGTEYLAPTTDEGWLRAAALSSTVAESANSLMTPERIRRLASADEDWVKFARKMSSEALASREAALAHDSGRLYTTGASLYQACVACHQKYLLPFLEKGRTYKAPGAPGGPERP